MRVVDRAGFTLIEVLVALALSVLIVSGVRALLEGLAVQAKRVVDAAASTDSIAATTWSFHRIVGSLALPASDSLVFDGTATSARFASWCLVPGGWEERCRVVLSASPDERTGARLTLSTGESFVLLAGAGTSLRYLVSAADGGRWATEWRSTISPPAGIAVIARTDTLFAPTGDLR